MARKHKRREAKFTLNIDTFIRSGGVDAQIARVVRQEREHWLGVLEPCLPHASGMAAVILAREVRRLRRALGVHQTSEEQRAQTRRFRERQRAAYGRR